MSADEGLSVLSPDERDAIVAALDLVGRSGARQSEIGYLHDDVPTEKAGWYATAMFRGSRITAEERGPVEAAEALARRLLTGATCRRCGQPIRLGDAAAQPLGNAPGPTPGSIIAGVAACLWTRVGATWEAGCGRPIDQTIPHPLAR